MALKTPQAVADRLDSSPQTLANWRSSGKGPAFIKVGGRVMYDDADVDAWLLAQRRTSTAQNSLSNGRSAA